MVITFGSLIFLILAQVGHGENGGIFMGLLGFGVNK
jgi:hypothetical protein